MTDHDCGEDCERCRYMALGILGAITFESGPAYAYFIDTGDPATSPIVAFDDSDIEGPRPYCEHSDPSTHNYEYLTVDVTDHGAGSDDPE
jgi:hypothetical protein